MAPTPLQVPRIYAPPPTPSSSSAAWIVLLLLVGAVLLVGIGAGVFLILASGSDPVAETEAVDEPDEPEGDPLAVEEPDPEEAPAASVRLRDCPGAARVGKREIRTALTRIGWQPSGELVFCAGDMINLRCQGPGGRGFTAESAGRSGSVVPIDLGTPAEVSRYLASEADSDDELTLATGRVSVLRVEMPAADADRLLDQLCR
jgi:hypothetical protein